jgi:uncharacterized protein YjbJ (UPF0337 family)
MKWDRIAANWQQVKSSVQEHWQRLTEDDLDRIGGRKDQLINRLQARYGLTRTEANRQVEEYSRGA